MASLYNRKEAVKLNFYRTDSHNSDWESLYRLSLRGKVKYLDLDVGVWRIHGANVSVSPPAVELTKSLATWSIVYKDAMDYGMSASRIKHLRRKCLVFFSSSYVGLAARSSISDLVIILSYLYDIDRIALCKVLSNPKNIVRILKGFISLFINKIK